MQTFFGFVAQCVLRECLTSHWRRLGEHFPWIFISFSQKHKGSVTIVLKLLLAYVLVQSKTRSYNGPAIEQANEKPDVATALALLVLVLARVSFQ